MSNLAILMGLEVIMGNIFAMAAIIVLIYMTLVFILALYKKNNGIVDTAWGLGFILVSWAVFLRRGDWQARQWLALVLVLIWGGRLALHIHFRNRGKEEDFRYAAWRKSWGKYFLLRSFGQIFMLRDFCCCWSSRRCCWSSARCRLAIEFPGWTGLAGLDAGFFV